MLLPISGKFSKKNPFCATIDRNSYMRVTKQEIFHYPISDTEVNPTIIGLDIIYILRDKLMASNSYKVMNRGLDSM